MTTETNSGRIYKEYEDYLKQKNLLPQMKIPPWENEQIFYAGVAYDVRRLLRPDRDTRQVLSLLRQQYGEASCLLEPEKTLGIIKFEEEIRQRISAELPQSRSPNQSVTPESYNLEIRILEVV